MFLSTVLEDRDNTNMIFSLRNNVVIMNNHSSFLTSILYISKSDQLEEETKNLDKPSGDIRLFCFDFNKNIETNLPIKKPFQKNLFIINDSLK